ncbi:MAG: hypothetical protein CO002_02165 [Candidatus Portnoybacteria bacterium CG_4_8_14_3_um_filter_44_10]|uniref:Uncharacterized protein n=5 Tax=Candidatus Portnoyibacteriota TaxID=1817913 RepID=A0A2M7IG16_9BACT|nr:MAG: hypothetical protein CO002_02165 [Candidatus Portnoybacteria bacterium CG_4_8_14_3_um_filter_44_10]
MRAILSPPAPIAGKTAREKLSRALSVEGGQNALPLILKILKSFFEILSMRYSINTSKIRLKQTLLGAIFLILFMAPSSPAHASLFDKPIDLGALSYDSIVNDVMKNRCPFNDQKSYDDYRNACVNSSDNCLPMTQWFKSDTGFVPIEGVVVSNSAGNKFYPRTCFQANFQNNSTAIPAVPTVEGASTETPEVQVVTGASDVSFSVTVAAVASGSSLVILYLVLVNHGWFTRLWLKGYFCYARFMER